MSKIADDQDTVPLQDFGELWTRFEQTPADRLVEGVREYDDEATRRRLLTAWLAYRLGYSRLFARREQLETDPLWDLLDRRTFERLGREGERALLFVARSTRERYGRTLNRKAALAAIALWRHARESAIRQEAEQILAESALPDERAWLYRLVRRFVGLGAARGLERPGLFQLAALQLGGRYWESAAKIGALYLVRRYRPTRSTPEPWRLDAACDRAAQGYHRREGDWLELMAEAAMGGLLRHSWLERPVDAALRLSVDEPERYERLRAFHRRRLYDADHTRLEQLYGHLLDESVRADSASRLWARGRLVDEIWMALDENPKRAQRLAELVIIHDHPVRLGTFARQRLHALRQVEAKPDLGLIEELLAGLYVATYDIDPAAVKLVHRVSDRVDWQAHPVATEQKLESYLKIGDYDRAFEDLTFDIEGVTLELADKDAALRARYFLEKRIDAMSVTHLVQQLLRPIDWLGSELRIDAPLEEGTEQAALMFSRWTRETDLEEQVVDDYMQYGVSVAEFDDISRVGADFVDEMVVGMRNRRMMLSAASGVVGGGCMPFDIPVLRSVSLPFTIGACLDACVRFCWYYGFDPREHPELPVEILAVSMQGPQPERRAPDEICRSLADFSLQTSMVVEAIGRRSADRITGRILRGIAEHFSTSGYGDAAAVMLERLARRRARSVERHPGWAVARGAVVGGLLDAALVYDVCESARAVLSDRFLARKYPGWERRVGWVA
jgi:hypothetical protein